ncbi:MAG: UDP-N-acetylglucosamine 2-epimerase, partial [Proteobacteria bacterium]|nr:UDP-N-acetylglucosamine 2-epimerase [Pseudomonadota bacterium]
EKLAAQGAKINYLVAQAERSQEITAIETGLPYNHVFDFLKESDKDQIHDIYIDLRNAFGKTLVKDIAFSLQVQTVLDKTISTTAQEYIAFKNYFETNRPDLCLALHEVNRWGKMFSFHAKKSGVPFITLQEGLLTAASANLNFQMTGHVQYSTFCFVWGENSRQKLISFEAPEERVIPVGNTHLSDEIQTLAKKKLREKTRKKYNCGDLFVVLLLFSSDLPPMDEMRPLFNAFQNNPKLKLFTKFHPATTRNKLNIWMESLSENFKEKIHPVHGEENTYNLMAASDLCVLSEGSTTGLEALALGKTLVLLQLKAPVIYKSTLVEDKAAIGMSPIELADAIAQNTDFEKMMDHPNVEKYLQNELFKSKGSIEYAIDILKSVVDANQAQNPVPLISKQSCELDWSIILPVSQNPENFLSLLEDISIHSGDESFEVILIKEDNISETLQQVLDSLEGNISILDKKKKIPLPEILNQASIVAKGKYLIFMEPNLAPKKHWLTALRKGLNQFDGHKIFGARIINKFNNIVHSGIVLNPNNQPVSAYLHLDDKFPHACKTRAFQMVDHFICTRKDDFLSAGGFEARSGKYMFLDLCLRSIQMTSDPETVMYLHDVTLLSLDPSQPDPDHEDSIFFHSKWHGTLWESEEQLLKSDGVSTLQLDAARMTRAMQIAPFK